MTLAFEKRELDNDTVTLPHSHQLNFTKFHNSDVSTSLISTPNRDAIYYQLDSLPRPLPLLCTRIGADMESSRGR